MISVENLYWSLYDNLLRHTGIDCWYYYPFGTMQNMSLTGEFQPLTLCEEHHVLFHFDQEPIWQDDFGMYDNFLRRSWSSKLVRILANSEKSAFKKSICRDRGMLDWYFFFHGFAALDWYRDAQHIYTQQDITSAFLSLNHLIRDQRAYRISMLARLNDLGVLHRGQISFHGTASDIQDELDSRYSLLSDQDRDIILRYLQKLPNLPIALDQVTAHGDLSARFGHQEYKMWQSSLLHIVNETVFYQPKLHLTEKIFKPIVAMRPFVLVAAPGNLAYLRSYGFQTFSSWIDESYDNVEDKDQRLSLISREVARISGLSLNQLRELHKDMLPILEFNRQHFFGEFRRIIVEELVDNFDACCRIWNNGRVDSREIRLVPDLDQAKKALLG